MFIRDNMLVFWEITYSNGKRATYAIPMNHAQIIAANLLAGMAWWVASPLYVITREDAGYILAHAEEIMKAIV